MYKKKTSAQLKQAARGIMIGKYRNAISLILASDLIISTLSLFTTTASNSAFGIAIGFIISFILTILGTILNVGQCSFYLNIACEQPYDFTKLFNGFKIHPDKTIITQVIVQLLTAIPMIPAIAAIAIAAATGNVSLVLPACLLLILGTGISWWIYLK